MQEVGGSIPPGSTKFLAASSAVRPISLASPTRARPFRPCGRPRANLLTIYNKR
jgi:hypothetical protein